MQLKLNGIDVDCIIGERPDERNRIQRLRIDVELDVDCRAEITDELSDTVDYALLTERIRAALVAAKCRMIERAARIAAEVCLSDARVRRVAVSVTKRGAILGLESATAVYEG